MHEQKCLTLLLETVSKFAYFNAKLNKNLRATNLCTSLDDVRDSSLKQRTTFSKLNAHLNDRVLAL